MRVRVHPADMGGCGHYRLIFVAEALKAQGEHVRVEYDREYRGVWQSTAFGERLVGIDGPVHADVVVLQRPLRRERYELMRALQAKGAAVVVEVDDDFHAIHKRNPAWAGTSPMADPEHNRDWLMKACKAADLVTVSTPALARRYGEHGRVVVLPNYVPEKYLTREPGPYTDAYLERLTGTVAGWTGSVATHPDDLEATGGAIPGVLAETGAKFHVIGTGKKVARGLGLAEDPSSTGWLPIEAYPEAIRQIDVGIVPLASHVFNEAKSWLKGLEFASLGVPFVATPTGPYRDLFYGHGLGFLASTPDDWADMTRRLLADPVFREEESIRHREHAAALTTERNAWRWMEAWERAVQYRHARVAA